MGPQRSLILNRTHAGVRARSAVRLPSLGSQPPQGKSPRTGGAGLYRGFGLDALVPRYSAARFTRFLNGIRRSFRVRIYWALTSS